MSVSVGVWTLVSISLERYFAICRPLTSRSWQTRSHAYRVIVCIWLASAACSSPIAIYSQYTQIGETGRHKCRETWPSSLGEKGYTIFLDIILLSVPLLLMSVMYSLISFRLYRGIQQERRIQRLILQNGQGGIPGSRSVNGALYAARLSKKCMIVRWRSNQQQQLQPHEQHAMRNHNPDRSIQAKRKVIQMLAVLVLEFFICWTPLFVMNTWVLIDKKGVYGSLGRIGVSLIQLLAYVSSCSNPITYCFMHRKFRKAFKSTVMRCCSRSDGEELPAFRELDTFPRERIIRGFLSAIGLGVASSGWNPWVRLYSGFVTLLQLFIILWKIRSIIDEFLYGLPDFYDSIFIFVDLLTQNSGLSAIYQAVFLMISERFMVAPTLLLLFLLQFAVEKFTRVNVGFQDSDSPDIVPLVKLHFKLAEFVHGLSEAFSVNLVVLTAFCFMSFTSNFMMMIVRGISVSLRICGFKTAFTFNLLYAVVSWGQSVSNKANKSTKLARRLEMNDLDGRSRKQLQLFLSSLACSPVELSALDFFTLDKRMLLSRLQLTSSYSSSSSFLFRAGASYFSTLCKVTPNASPSSTLPPPPRPHALTGTSAEKRKLKKTAFPSINLPLSSTDVPSKIRKKMDSSRARKERRDRRNFEIDPTPILSHEERNEANPDENDGINIGEDDRSRDEAAMALLQLQCGSPLPAPTADVAVNVSSGDLRPPFISLIMEDSKIKTLTGVPTVHLLNTLVRLLATVLIVTRKHVLSLEEQLLLSLMKIKLNLSYNFLGVLFIT
ncbi:unnamed protein product [Darwinula stevensoni]|uniref:G-protein coupled receptors family 1 profile domain-containing protein n=1 Tax=Darwinula stevensoni TaxID=69355 RepID=A0A7R8X8W6_9CRUS|nr:unnamed protein product [Darwinula stevensoni]CAG0883816.1 unnamed protein product [Darwinula stevensoni]